mmetsp:Transcript_21797/g.31633  ORF Transcript_21797/g.31633 Transcript_21797/m.31633 type:complete len:236 (+) Transcript_21797:1042-1749(+)
MSSVGGVAGLESEHNIRSLPGKFRTKLLEGQSVLVQAIVVADALQKLNFSTNQVVTARVDVLDVGVAGVDHAEDAGHNLLLAVVVDLGVAQDSHGLPVLGHQGDGLLARLLNVLLRVRGTGQHDRHAHGHAGVWRGNQVVELSLLLVEGSISCGVVGVDEDGVEVQGLEQRPLAHEALERGCPSLPNGLKPVEIDVGEADLGQGLGLPLPSCHQVPWHLQVHHLVTIGHGQASGI